SSTVRPSSTSPVMRRGSEIMADDVHKENGCAENGEVRN
ncbi:uncharacterized protein METZ01_LOCUS298492, partial [marine metagenome]